MDALPIAKTVGQKPAYFGINRIGLSRKGMSAETIRRLEEHYREFGEEPPPFSALGS